MNDYGVIGLWKPTLIVDKSYAYFANGCLDNMQDCYKELDGICEWISWMQISIKNLVISGNLIWSK